MKRWVSLLLAGSMLVGLLTGCSPSNSSSKAQPESEAAKVPTVSSGQKYTVQFWHALSGQNLKYLTSVITDYNSSHPDIQVVSTYQGSYKTSQTKLQTAVASGNTPDVCMLERSNVQYFADSDALEDLAPYLKESKMTADLFTEGLMGHSTFGGKLVSLPFNRSEPILFVNKTLFQEMNLTAPKTWDELKEASNALVQKKDGKVTRYGFSMPYDTWYPMAMLTQCGGKFFNDEGTDVGYTDAQMNKVFNFLVDALNTGAMYYPPQQGGGDRVDQMFAAGQLGMVFQSTGMNGAIKKLVDGKFEYEMVFMPKDEKYAQPTGGGNVVIPAKAENKAAAWEFVKWLVTDPKGAQQFIIESGYLPFTKAMTESAEIKAMWEKDPNLKVAYDQLQYAVDTNKSTNWPLVENDFKTAMSAILYDKKDVAATVTTFTANAKKNLKQ